MATVASAFSSGPCPPAGCSTNSPVIDNLIGFHDLSLIGTPATAPGTEPDDAGLGIVAAGEARRAQIVQAGKSYDLSVVDGSFIGTCGPLCPPLMGKDLVGATITLTYAAKPAYVMTIETVRTMRYFLGGGTVDAYTLTWQPLGGGSSTNVCNNIPLIDKLLRELPDDAFRAQELMGMEPWETVVFEGDKIDQATKTMDKVADDSWFNIGCASHLLAKLRLTRNTVHGQAPGLSDAWEQRQATMKLLAADYCGTGDSFTVPGQLLVWQGDLMRYYRTPATIEARWTERGAKCISQPRMLQPTSALGASTFPDVWTSIKNTCGRRTPPKCANVNPRDYDGTPRVSANPK